MDTEQPRVLRRPLADRFIGGVCAGIARYFALDPTLVRLGWVIFTLLGGSGLLAYLIAWAVIPDDAGQRNTLPLVLLVLMFVLPVICTLLWFVVAVPVSMSR